MLEAAPIFGRGLLGPPGIVPGDGAPAGAIGPLAKGPAALAPKALPCSPGAGGLGGMGAAGGRPGPLGAARPIGASDPTALAAGTVFAPAHTEGSKCRALKARNCWTMVMCPKQAGSNGRCCGG